VLSSSDRGGIRIQYSKNPFGRREPGSSPPSILAGSAGDHDGGSLTAALTNGAHHSPHAAGLGAAGLLTSMAGGMAAGGAPQAMVAPQATFIGQAGMQHVLGSDV
jgi:hypothetical protein